MKYSAKWPEIDLLAGWKSTDDVMKKINEYLYLKVQNFNNKYVFAYVILDMLHDEFSDTLKYSETQDTITGKLVSKSGQIILFRIDISLNIVEVVAFSSANLTKVLCNKKLSIYEETVEDVFNFLKTNISQTLMEN